MTENKSFMMPTLKSKVWKYLDEHPTANIFELYFTFKNSNHKTLKDYKCIYKKEHSQMTQEHVDNIKILLTVMTTKMNPMHSLSGSEKQAIESLALLVEKS